MATNWNAVLANVNNSADILAILRKVLSLLELKVDGTTIDEVLAQLEKVAADGQITIEEALETLTFLDQKIDERTSAFNEAIEAAAAAGAGANGWTALLVQDGPENQALINLRLKTMFVFPEHFNDDIVAAAEFAAFNNATLVTKNKTYKLSQEFVLPENLTWLSCFTTIEQIGDALASKTASGLAPRSNVKLTGDLTIDMGVPTTNPWGEKCHVRLDSFNNITPQVRGFYFETLRF